MAACGALPPNAEPLEGPPKGLIVPSVPVPKALAVPVELKGDLA